MVNEKLNSDQDDSAENSEWNMDDMEFAGKDANEAEKDVLRQEVCEKIDKDKRARNIFKKVILGTVIASSVMAGVSLGMSSKISETQSQPAKIEAYYIPVEQKIIEDNDSTNLDAEEPRSSSESEAPSQEETPVEQEVIENNDSTNLDAEEPGSFYEPETPYQKISVEQVVEKANHFVDCEDDDDLVWFEVITDNSGTTIEHGSDSTAELNSNQIGEIDTVEMDWWKGRGDIFKVTDTNADGKWDVAQRMDPSNGSTRSINFKKGDGAPSTMSETEQLFDHGSN